MRKYRQDIKLLEEGGSDKDAITLKKAKYHGKMQEYEAFSKAMKLPMKKERIYQDGLGKSVKGIKSIPRAKLGAGFSKKNAKGTPIFLGEIDVNFKEEAIKYYNEQIRYAEIEYAFIIDPDGKVYYSEGDSDSVKLDGVDLRGAMITHNHPESNGIVSFGEEDFDLLQNNQHIHRLIAVNSRYTYSVTLISSLDHVSYHEFYRKAMEEADLADLDFDLQHKVFEILDREGYVKYVREEYDKETKRND